MILAHKTSRVLEMETVALDGKRFKAYEENMTWFRANYEKLRKKHPNEFVAINKGDVIASDKTLEGLLKNLRKQYTNDQITTFAIEYVSETDAELIML
jgi:Family of unknown function (DUF5678)